MCENARYKKTSKFPVEGRLFKQETSEYLRYHMLINQSSARSIFWAVRSTIIKNTLVIGNLQGQSSLWPMVSDPQARHSVISLEAWRSEAVQGGHLRAGPALPHPKAQARWTVCHREASLWTTDADGTSYAAGEEVGSRSSRHSSQRPQSPMG